MSVKQCKCKNSIEDDAHILDSSKSNHKLITLRHDHLVAKITKELKKSQNSAEIWIDRHWRSDLQLVKPDITMLKDGHCYIVEVTCPYESSMDYPEQRVRDKTSRYKPLLHELSQVNCNSGEVLSLVFGSLETINNTTNKILKYCK